MFQSNNIIVPSSILYVVKVDGIELNKSYSYEDMLSVVKDWRANHAHCMSNHIKIVAK